MVSSPTIASLSSTSDLLIFGTIFLIIFSGWVIGTVLVAELRSQSGLTRHQTAHIWLADNLSGNGSGLPRRLSSALKREFADVPGRLPIQTVRLRRCFPVDPEAWKRLLADAPKSIDSILPAGKPGVLIWAECTEASKSARLHFLPSSALADYRDPGNVGLTTLEDVPLALRSGLPPIIASLALAYLAPVFEEAGIGGNRIFAVPAKKLTLHIDELTSQCSGRLGWAALYLYAWMRFRLGLDDGHKGDLNALCRKLRAQIEQWPDDRPQQEHAQIWSSLAKLCFDWGTKFKSTEPLERSVLAADTAIAIFSGENSLCQKASTQHLKARTLLALSEMRRDPEPLQNALTALRAAAHIRRREGDLAGWALLRHRMGQVHTAYARYRAGTKDLESAIGAFSDALTAPGEDRAVTRARSRLALGIAHLDLGMRDGNPLHFEKAVLEFKGAFDTLSALGDFENANSAHIQLGLALTGLGSLTGDVAPLNRAVAGLRFAPPPVDYKGRESNAQHLLSARAHRLVGCAEGALEPLRKSVKKFEALSQSGDDETQTELRAVADFERGQALAELGRVAGSAGPYGDAASAFREALRGFGRTECGRQWATVQLHLGRVLAKMASSEFRGGNGFAGDAAEAYRHALSIFKRAETPHIWTELQDELGAALQLSGARRGGKPDLESAVTAWRKALNGKTIVEAPPRDRPLILNDLGNALSDLAHTESDASRLREAHAAYLEAFDLALARRQDSLAEIFRSNLDLTERALSS